MKTLCISLFLLALSCGAPKDKIETKNEETKNTTPPKKTKEIVKPKVEEAENLLLVVLKNPKATETAKAMITNSGLKWKEMILDEATSKIALIEVPKGKKDFWIDRFKTSGPFKSIVSNSKEAADKLIEKEKSTLISIQKTSCMGDCPVYDVVIDKKGNVTFEGKQYVTEKGVKEFKLTDEELKTLNEKLKSNDTSSFKETYDNPKVMDLGSTYIVLKGKQVHIRLWNDDVPESLMDIHEYLEGILLDKKLFE